MIRAARLLHLRRIRLHPLRAVVLLASVAAGVSMAVAVLVVQTSLTTSFADHGRSLGGPAPLRVVGPSIRGGLATSTLPRVERTEGVAAAVPVVQAVTIAQDTSGGSHGIVALGVDCRVEALVGDFGCTPGSVAGSDPSAPPIVSSWLADTLGPEGIVRTDLGDRPAVGGTIVEALDEVNDGRVAVYAMPVAQDLFVRPDAFDAIYVVPSDGVAPEALVPRLQEAAGPQNTVLRATDTPESVAAFGPLVPLLGFLSLFALGIGATLVRNTLALAVAERRRDLAIAGAVGAGPGVLVGGALVEAGLLGLLGGLLGAGVGVLLADPLLGSFETLTLRMAGAPLHLQVGWLPFGIGAVLGLLLAVLAGLKPALNAGRPNVVAHLGMRRPAEDPVTRPRIRRAAVLLGVALVALLVTVLAGRRWPLEPWSPTVAQPAFLVVNIALFWAAGSAAPWIFHHASRRSDGLGPAWKLGLANLTRERLRTSVMVVAAASAVGVAFTMSSFSSMLGSALVETRLKESGGGVYASTVPRNNALALDAKPSPELTRALSRVPGVARLDTGTAVAFRGPDGGMWGATSPPARVPYEILAGSADPERLERGEVVIGPTIARMGIDPGDRLTLPAKEGLRDVVVQGIWANGDFNGHEISMATWMIEDLWGPQPPDGVVLHPAPGLSPDELARRIRSAELDPHLDVLSPTDQEREAAGDVAVFFQPFWALQRGLIVIAFAAVLFTLLLAAIQRRREHGLLGAVGMEPGGLARLVLAEGAAVALVGTFLGTVCGVVLVEALREAFFLTVPYRIPFRLDLVSPIAYGLVALGVIVAAAAWPAWRTSRLQVVEALRYE